MMNFFKHSRIDRKNQRPMDLMEILLSNDQFTLAHCDVMGHLGRVFQMFHNQFSSLGSPRVMTSIVYGSINFHYFQ